MHHWSAFVHGEIGEIQSSGTKGLLPFLLLFDKLLFGQSLVEHLLSVVEDPIDSLTADEALAALALSSVITVMMQSTAFAEYVTAFQDRRRLVCRAADWTLFSNVSVFLLRRGFVIHLVVSRVRNLVLNALSCSL